MDKQRERLVELLEEADQKVQEYILENDHMDWIPKPKELAEVRSDYLLANGVIVPPCKVGDVVYRIVEMSTGVTTVIKRTLCPPYTCETIINCKPTIKRFIRSVVVTKNNFFDVCENYGKTVFLTKEEAEAKLKEGVQ